MRDCSSVSTGRLHSNIHQACPLQPAEHPLEVRAETYAVAVKCPENSYQSEHYETHHEGGEKVFLPDHTAIEKGQAGCHE